MSAIPSPAAAAAAPVSHGLKRGYESEGDLSVLASSPEHGGTSKGANNTGVVHRQHSVSPAKRMVGASGTVVGRISFSGGSVAPTLDDSTLAPPVAKRVRTAVTSTSPVEDASRDLAFGVPALTSRVEALRLADAVPSSLRLVATGQHVKEHEDIPGPGHSSMRRSEFRLERSSQVLAAIPHDIPALTDGVRGLAISNDRTPSADTFILTSDAPSEPSTTRCIPRTPKRAGVVLPESYTSSFRSTIIYPIPPPPPATSPDYRSKQFRDEQSRLIAVRDRRAAAPPPPRALINQHICTPARHPLHGRITLTPVDEAMKDFVYRLPLSAFVWSGPFVGRDPTRELWRSAAEDGRGGKVVSWTRSCVNQLEGDVIISVRGRAPRLDGSCALRQVAQGIRPKSLKSLGRRLDSPWRSRIARSPGRL